VSDRRALAVASEWGYWGIELVAPLQALEAAGWTVDVATPKGGRPPVLGPSVDPSFVDTPLGVHVTTEEDAAVVREFEATDRLDKPLDLAALFPERPYFHEPDFLRRFEDYFEQCGDAQARLLATYDTVFIAGGSGPIIDVANNQRVHDLVLGFWHGGRIVGAICYGVTTLAFARDFNDRTPIIAGKHVTGHCLEYDYHDGTGFAVTDLNIGPPPYPLEFVLRDAVGPHGQYHGNFGRRTSVVVDAPFITARSLQCSHEFGQKYVEMLTTGLTRYGW
jgi:putative intracellular protease/amidase